MIDVHLIIKIRTLGTTTKVQEPYVYLIICLLN